MQKVCYPISPFHQGLQLENFIAPSINATLSVLHGRVIVEVDGANHSLASQQNFTLPDNRTHVVHTVSDAPSCYMYVYRNTSLQTEEDVKKDLEGDDGEWGYIFY